MKLPKHVHKKTAKGRTYYYLNMGDGLVRLPDIRSPRFPTALQAALSQRTKKRGPEGVKSFDWLCRLYEKSPEWRALSESSKNLYALHLGYANAILRNAQGHSAPLSVITAEQAMTIRDRYADQPATANGIIKAIGSLYAWALTPGRKYVKENIVAGVGRLATGEHVHGFVHLTQQKTGKALKIAVHSRLAQILEADAPKGAMLYLLNERGKPLTGPALRARLQKWAAARGVKIVPHGLRKSAVNALLEAQCSTAEIAAITGQTMQMIEHYGKGRDLGRLSSSAILKFEARDKTGTGGERENGR
jgi:23S rRNA pseudoU1915 N3-methylase RlmH